MKNGTIGRRELLRKTAAGTAAIWITGSAFSQGAAPPARKPNLLFLLADQWRAQATGFAGDPDARTPNLDRLAAQSVQFTNAVSGCPVCCPYRASLMTGQNPLTHGVFLNDLCLGDDADSIAETYAKSGYDTGYIGKWHLDGHGRSNFIPRKRRHGFDYWKVLECTHNYNNSAYYAGDSQEKLKWEEYDAIAQTRDARRYIVDHAKGKPFILFLSWGPPHAPYLTAPQKYQDLYRDRQLTLRPNVPKALETQARRDLAGYYAHIAALDDCLGEMLAVLKEQGLERDTIVVFTADHGDMLYSQGERKKQRPWDESIRVPFLLRYPARLGSQGKTTDMPIGTPDIMPTLLGLSGVDAPATVEGKDYSGVALGIEKPENDAVLITCPSPFGQWLRANGGREYRGVRTRRHTYVRDLKGPWLLYDNEEDPYQQRNLCGNPEVAELQGKLETLLSRKLKETGDEFLPGEAYIEKWGYKVDKGGTVAYTG